LKGSFMCRKKVLGIAVGLLIMIPVIASAQTAAELETLLGARAVTCAQAAGFVLSSIEDKSSIEETSSIIEDTASEETVSVEETALTDEDTDLEGAPAIAAAADEAVIVQLSPEEAFEQAMAKGWLPKGAAADDPITLGGLSLLMMKAFNLKGSMMYAIFPGPRYAFRAMVSRSFIQGAADPGMKVSGERFLLILGKVLNTTGG
jgi:hypothetical protein